MLYPFPPITLPANVTFIMEQSDYQDLDKQYRDLKGIRGHFLEIMIAIEEDIDTYIEKCLIAKNSKTKFVFKEKVLHSKSFTLKRKVGLLRDICECRKDLTKRELVKLHTDLSLIVDERNVWAHGRFNFQQKTIKGKRKMQSYLKYYNRDGQQKIKKLTDEYFNKLNSFIISIHERLTKMMVNSKLLPKSTLDKFKKKK